jgi:type IV pilus assembly protein PilC
MQTAASNEYRVVIRDPSGKITRRQIIATSVDQAKRRATTFISRGSVIQSIEKKNSYEYRVRQGDKIIEGTQSAYSKEEVTLALNRLGFKILSVRRRRAFFSKAPSNEIVSFVMQSSKLIEQKLPFQDVLQLMANHTKEKNLRGALREIINDLRNGSDSREAFMRQAHVFGYHTSLMLGIATKSGDMKKIFESVAQLVERQSDFSKGLVSSLMLPAITALTLVGAIGFYVVYLLPQMMEMLGPRMEKIPPLTAFTLELSAWFKDNFIFLAGIIILICVAFYVYIGTPAGRLNFHKYLIRVPYVGRILRDTSIEIFCRVFGIMYTSSGENIDAIQIAGEASGNPYLAHQVRTVAIPLMLRYGVELGRAMDEMGFFSEIVISRFKTGAETGNVKDTAIQVADYYQMENGYAMKNLSNVIEMSVTVMITISLAFLTYLSSETANVRLK